MGLDLSQSNDVANKATDTGNSAIASFDPQGFASTIKSGFNNLFGDQQNSQNDFINSYKQAVASNPSVTSLYDTANSKYNVQPLQQQANTLTNAVLQAPQQTLDTARGFNYDQNQVNNQTNLTLGRLSPLASAAQNNASTAQTNANNYVQAGIAQNQQNLLPIQQQASMMSDLWARQASGYTTAAQAELEGLINKMNAGVTLSTAEMARANALATAEASYQSSVNSANASIQAAQINQQNQVLSPNQAYLNTITGKSQIYGQS